MGRPSLADQRRDEILAAVGRCVARYGVAGTTLERVSTEAGLSRGHVRHYLGNRDALITAFADQVGEHYVTTMKQVLSNAPEGGQSTALLGVLFGPAWAPSEDNPAIDALLGAAATDEALSERMRLSYLEMEALVTSALRADFPSASPARCRQTSYALISMAFGNSTLSQLGFPVSRRRAARAIAAALLDLMRAPKLRCPDSGPTGQARPDSSSGV
jgi:AcrR family transcriptional regulator